MNYFRYVINSGSNCLMTEFDENETIIDFQTKIISQKHKEGLLKAFTLIKDTKTEFYYDVTSMISLSQYLHSRKITEACIISILSSICRTIINSLNYLLWEENFLLKNDFIFVNASNLKVEMVYLPISNHKHDRDTFTNFLKDVLMCLLSNMELKSGKLIEILAERVSFGNVYPSELLGILKDFDNSRLQNSVAKEYQQELSIIETQVKATQIKDTNKRDGIINKIFPIFLNKSRNINKEKNIESVSQKELNMECNDLDEALIKNIKETRASHNETTILSEEKFVKLLFENEQEDVVFEVEKTPFRIGRFKELVDFDCKNLSVGKVHAEIYIKGLVCFLRDLNSKNGSFINGERLLPSKDYLIKHGDSVSFANQTYRVKISVI